MTMYPMNDTLKDAMIQQWLATRQTTPTQIELGDGLVLRSVCNQADADRYAAFNRDYVSPIQGLTCANLLAHHPTMRGDDFFFVEDERAGIIVSCICLIPWHCRIGSDEVQTDLRVAMLEMVVTHPDYRHRGLVRRQIEHFHHVVADQGFDLCIIEGIPYYYRQYGYAYATDHWASDSLPLARVPDRAEGAMSVRLRPATMADVTTLDDFYMQTMGKLAAWTTRSSEYWRYLIECAAAPIAMLEDVAHSDASHGTPLGYVMAWRTDTGAHIAEHGIPTASAASAFLQWCKAHFDGELILGWPAVSPLIAVARMLGSSVRPADQWLLRAVDLPRLLLKFAPVLAVRLAASPYAGLTSVLTLNLYRQAYHLRFVAGALIAVEPLGFVDASMGADGGDLCIPPDAFMRLLLGYRTLDELSDAWPDIVVRPTRRHLWQVLWPKQEAYFWMPYMAFRADTRKLSDESSQYFQPE